MGPNLVVFPLEQFGHVGVAKSEHPRLTNGEITERSARRCSAVLTMGERTGGLSLWPRPDWSCAAVIPDSIEA